MMQSVLRLDLVDLVLVVLFISIGIVVISPVVFSAFFKAKEDHLMRLAQRISKDFTSKGSKDGQDS